MRDPIDLPPAPFTQAQLAVVQREARPMLRRALRHGLLIGFALGFVACCIVLALVK